MTLLEASPRHWFTWDHEIRRDGRPIATVSLGWLKEKGEFELAGHEFTIRRESLAGDFLLEAGGVVVCRATKTSVFTRTFVVKVEGEQFALEAESVFKRALVLKSAGVEVGSVRAVSIWSRKAQAQFPDEIALPVQVFLLWLVLVMWRRAANNNSS